MRLCVIVATLVGCDFAALDDAQLLEQAMHDAVAAGGFELLQNRLGVRDQIFQLFVRMFGFHEFDQFHFVELMLADQAKKEGISDLRESGTRKVAAGVTSLEELNRVITV